MIDKDSAAVGKSIFLAAKLHEPTRLNTIKVSESFYICILVCVFLCFSVNVMTFHTSIFPAHFKHALWENFVF